MSVRRTVASIVVTGMLSLGSAVSLVVLPASTAKAANVLTTDTSVRVDCKLSPGETIGHWDTAYWQGWTLYKVDFRWYTANGNLAGFTSSPTIEGDRARDPSAYGAVRVDAQFDFDQYRGGGSYVHLFARTSSACVA